DDRCKDKDPPENKKRCSHTAAPDFVRASATRSVTGVTRWLDDEPLDLDAISDAELEREARLIHRCTTPNRKADRAHERAYEAWKRKMDAACPVGAPLESARYEPKWRKAVIHIPPRAKPSMSDCIRYATRRWPGVTNVVVLSGG